MTKTNAMRLMAQAGIPIRVQEYEVDEATARENVRSFADKLTSAGVL